jgi:GT2 family glycosyltransferase
MINWRSRLSGIATGDQAIFVRREVFERMGGYAAIPLMEDIDLAKRLNRLGVFAGLYAQVVTSFRRWDTHGPIRTILLMWLLRFLYWTGVSPHTLSRWYAAVR